MHLIISYVAASRVAKLTLNEGDDNQEPGHSGNIRTNRLQVSSAMEPRGTSSLPECRSR